MIDEKKLIALLDRNIAYCRNEALLCAKAGEILSDLKSDIENKTYDLEAESA